MGVRELHFPECQYSFDTFSSCALEGVASVVAGIAGASVVVHSPQGCVMTVNSAYDAHEVDMPGRKIACTRLFENEVVMGASRKLRETILLADSTFGTEVIFVIGTCAADIIGEDIAGLCSSMQSEVRSELIPILAGGFRGNEYDGMEECLIQMMGLFTRENSNEKFVNIVLPQASVNPTWWADLYWVVGVLNRMGVGARVLTHNTPVSELRRAGEAEGTLLMSFDSGYGFAKKLKKEFGVPILLEDVPLPVGIENTARWLIELGECLGRVDVAEEIVKKGEKRVLDVLRRRALMIVQRYHNCRVAISSDASMAVSLLRMVYDELEMIPEALMVRECSKLSFDRAKEVLKKEVRELGLDVLTVFNSDGYKIGRTLEKVEVDGVFGSAWERYIAEKTGIKLTFDVFSPTNRITYLDRPYFGYEGMLNFLEIVANDWEMAFRSKRIVY